MSVGAARKARARTVPVAALGEARRRRMYQLFTAFYERTDPQALTMVLFMERRAVSRIEWRLAEH